MIYWVDGSGNVTYRLTDGLGSTVALCNGSGTVTDSWTYDVYGAVKTHSGSNATEFTFTGEQNDPNGLEYLRARYYDSATGRFLGRDALGGGYPYGGNNPASMVDPTGLYEMCGVPSEYGPLPCLDSTEFGLPACDWTGSCYLRTNDGYVGLSDSFGDACVFNNAAIYHCDQRQDAPWQGSDLARGVIWQAAVQARNAVASQDIPHWAMREFAWRAWELNQCLHNSFPFCGGQIISMFGFGSGATSLSCVFSTLGLGASFGALVTSGPGGWTILGFVFSTGGVATSC